MDLPPTPAGGSGSATRPAPVTRSAPVIRSVPASLGRPDPQIQPTGLAD